MTGRYHRKNENFFRGELTIRDVCDECNNGELSKLDNYICELYDRYFHRIVKQSGSIVFKYDQNRLLRWLLKISFNSARSNGSDSEELRGLSTYILSGTQVPCSVSLRAELVKPSRNLNYVKGNGSKKYIEPNSVRCCRIESQLGMVPGATLRLVSINSYYFWIVVSPITTSLERDEENHLNGILTQLPKSELLGKDQVTLKARGKTTIEMHKDWVLNPRARESHKKMIARKG